MLSASPPGTYPPRSGGSELNHSCRQRHCESWGRPGVPVQPWTVIPPPVLLLLPLCRRFLRLANGPWSMGPDWPAASWVPSAICRMNKPSSLPYTTLTLGAPSPAPGSTTYHLATVPSQSPEIPAFISVPESTGGSPSFLFSLEALADTPLRITRPAPCLHSVR